MNTRLDIGNSTGFVCPKCTGPMGVLDSRQTTDGTVRRRRRCVRCQHRLTTYEVPFDEGAKIIGLSGFTVRVKTLLTNIADLQQDVQFLERYAEMVEEMKKRV